LFPTWSSWSNSTFSRPRPIPRSILVLDIYCLYTTRGVHCGLAIYNKKYLKTKRSIMETQIFSPWKNMIFKKSSKRNQNPSRYYNSLTNLKFQHKPKYHLSEMLI
jgi:hypothetical protein